MTTTQTLQEVPAVIVTQVDKNEPFIVPTFIYEHAISFWGQFVVNCCLKKVGNCIIKENIKQQK